MSTMYITIGLPASGKTTWAKDHVSKNKNTVIVCRDDIRAELFAHKYIELTGEAVDFLITQKIDDLEAVCLNIINATQDQIKKLETQGQIIIEGLPTPLKKRLVLIKTDTRAFRWRDYRFTKAKEQKVTEAQEQRINDAILHGKDIIIADTNLNPKVQNKLKELAKTNNYKVEVIDFTSVPVVECIRRDEKRDNSVGRGVILGMFEKYICKPTPKYDLDLKMAAVFDMDGTLCHMNGKRSPYEWDKVMLDDPDPEVINILNMYKQRGYVIIIFTARDGVCADGCIRWLQKYNILFDHFCSKDEGDTRKDYVVKQEMYEKYLKGKYNIEVVFDDREQVVLDVWRRNGIKCLQVANGCF